MKRLYFPGRSQKLRETRLQEIDNESIVMKQSKESTEVLRMSENAVANINQYVLTVFLPLLAIAILACAGGCCYMERRRKRRKTTNGGPLVCGASVAEPSSSMVDFPLPEVARERRGFGSRSSLMRSMSQPNLINIGTKTFPQGILKKVYDNDRYPIVSNQTSSSSDSGIKDIWFLASRFWHQDYGEVGDSGRISCMSQRHTMPNMQTAMDNQRQNSSSMMRYNPHANRPQNYDPYYAMRYGNYQNGMQQQGYSEQPIYSITGNGYQQHPHGGVYGSAYDYAGYHNGYMDHRPQGQRYRTPMYWQERY